jgi:hypothetical protein
VILNGAGRYAQAAGDLLAAQAGARQSQHLGLPAGQVHDPAASAQNGLAMISLTGHTALRSRRSCGEVAARSSRPVTSAPLRSLPSALHQRRGRAGWYIIRMYRPWPS